ncbi:ABC transporter substrate-binding protein [Thermophilibacter provencensis]|uniref:Extracellular solute-binding protein n=1 Tax=Thermophilibacter provencensis TaxID=1852386 RepID=A0ABT7V4Z7_9ACTN|nr:extracellular solute-binding protein [Thermophilibacter provencensis]MDM8271678.1 extracellular solute-binding protein [Thermophilibacter provencensis]
MSAPLTRGAFLRACAAGAAGAAVSLSACAGGGDENVQSEPVATNPSEGKLGGKLVVRTSCPELLVNAVIPAFTEKTGVTVRLVEAPVSDLLSWDEGESLDPDPDVVWGADPSWYEGLEELLEEYISGENGAMRAGCRNVGGCVTPVTREVAVLAVRAEEAASSDSADDAAEDQVVTGYASLLDEGLAGHVALADPQTSACGAAHVAAIDRALSQQGDGAALELLRELRAQGVPVADAGDALAALAEGECRVALVSEQLVSQAMLADALAVEPVCPEEGAYVTCGCTAIVRGCAHLAQAQAWIDYVTGQECQQEMAREACARPVREDVQDPEGFPEVGEPSVPEREVLLAQWAAAGEAADEK